MLGQNTPSAERLHGIVEEIEAVDEEKKALGERRSAIMATAKAEGFALAGIKHVLKARKKSQQDREDEDSIRDLYLHTMGMDDQPPLFRALGAMAGNTAGREQIIEAMKDIVPAGGEIILRIGDPVRIWRTADGVVRVEPWTPPQASPARRSDDGIDPDIGPPLPFGGKTPEAKLPDCTPDEAEDMGRQAARDGAGVIDNPFPHDDERRPRWDLGWRMESGGDGMGPKG